MSSSTTNKRMGNSRPFQDYLGGVRKLVKRQSGHKRPLMLSEMTPQKLSSWPRENIFG
jgi:hypothetical protein